MSCVKSVFVNFLPIYLVLFHFFSNFATIIIINISKMEFVGYTVGELVGVANIIRAYDGNYVFDDGGRTKLAIRLPSNNNTLFALFLCNEYNGDNEAIRTIIQSKAEETVRFFQETTAVINDYIPRLIYGDVMNILNQNNGNIREFQNNMGTDIVQNENVICLEHDLRRGIWYVNIGKILSFVIGNENSARRIYQLISRDISNYIRFRWCRPQR